MKSNKDFFTGCTHFGHFNIIRYCDRPFKTLEEMDNCLIKNANERVKEDDTVYHLGDFCFRNSSGGKQGEGSLNRSEFYQNRLKGSYIFVKGNHDKNNGLNTKNYRIILYVGGMYLNLIHNPAHTIINDESYYYPLTICSHVHTAWHTKEIVNKDGKVALCINCGVDMNNFRPVSFEEIMAIYHRWRNTKKNKAEIISWIEQSKRRPIYNR